MATLSARQARTFLAVAEHKSVTGAAKSINRSQTSVTKSIQDLERGLGVELFDRSSRGVTLTPYGEVLKAGAEEAAAAFEQAERFVPPALIQASPSVSRFFHMDVSDRWLDAFVATAVHQNVAGAAKQLGVTSAAVSASLRKLEDSLGSLLFERTPNAVSPTMLGRALVGQVKLARNRLHQACDELSSLEGAQRGRIRVGSLPFTRTLILPRAIGQVRRDHPAIDISTVEEPYNDLAADLRCGDIDFIIGALRGGEASSDLEEETLLEDQLSVIARCGHPLASKQKIDWPNLLEYEWILPRHETPTRELFENAIKRRGLAVPTHLVETSSLVILRGLLLETDAVTVLSRQQIVYEENAGLLTALPFPLPETSRPIGITRRAGSSASPAAKLLMSEIRKVVQDMAEKQSAA